MLKAAISLGKFKEKKCYQNIWAKYLEANSHASFSFLLNYRLPKILPLNLNSRLAANIPTVVTADGSVIVYIRETSGIGCRDIFKYRRHKA